MKGNVDFEEWSEADWKSVGIPVTYLYGLRSQAKKNRRSTRQQLLYFLEKAGCPQYSREAYEKLVRQSERQQQEEQQQSPNEQEAVTEVVA